MNPLMSFLIGFVGAIVAGSPLLIWAKKLGKKVYSNSRVKGMTGKLFKDDQLSRIDGPDSMVLLQKSRYWEVLQKSETRDEFESKLEALMKEDYKKILRLASEQVRSFLRRYHALKIELQDLKLILYCIANNKDKDLLMKLLRTDKYTPLLANDQLSETLNHLKNEFKIVIKKEAQEKYGLRGIEYELDRHFYGKLKKASKASLYEYYKMIRQNYLLQQILRLREIGFSDEMIVDILGLKKKKEIELVKTDINIILKTLSKRDMTLREMILEGVDNYKIFNYYFHTALLRYTIKQNKIRGAFNDISAVNLYNKIIREISVVKNLWVLK